MPQTHRGVIYITWGDSVDESIHRSMESLKLHHPDLPVHVERVTPRDPQKALAEKSRMAAISPFQTTLYLDADTFVMGNLDHAFEQAERFGLACAICESPWTRRYDSRLGDGIEYNTGVIFFTQAARDTFDCWEQLATTVPSASQWTKLDNRVIGAPYEDQAGFAGAVRETGRNPFVLPINYNFRPEYYRTAFLPLKIWHDYIAPPENLQKLSLAAERNERPVTYVQLQVLNPSQPPPHRKKP